MALLAGVAGLISTVFYATAHFYSAFIFFTTVFYLVSIVIAIVALLKIDRLVIVGLLQGMWWPAAAYLVSDIVAVSVDHLLGYTGHARAGYLVGIISDALGVIAAILLIVSWSRAAELRRASRFRALPVMLLSVAGSSQIAESIFLASAYPYATYYALGVASIFVGLAVTWYAVSLRARALGGALLLGWATGTAITLIAAMTGPWSLIPGAARLFSVLGCVLLATVVILTIIYMRGSDPDPSRMEVTDAVVGGD